MKKIVSYFLLLSSLFVGCFFQAVGAFAMADTDTHVQNETTNFHDSIGSQDSETLHTCCTTTYIESLHRTSNGDDESFLSDLRGADTSRVSLQALFQNNIDRLNSPPSGGPYNFLFQKDTYISLVGIVKNNS